MQLKLRHTTSNDRFDGGSLGTGLSYLSHGSANFSRGAHDELRIFAETRINTSIMKTRGLSHHDTLSICHTNTYGNIMQPCESPWFCYCNFTLPKIYVYANKFSSTSTTSTTTALGALSSSFSMVWCPSFHPCFTQVEGSPESFNNIECRVQRRFFLSVLPNLNRKSVELLVSIGNERARKRQYKRQVMGSFSTSLPLPLIFGFRKRNVKFLE
ncbi:uncharacterized protein EAF02_006044 [Botrytis sinoallii]|uniref:uncharacterized protein n=1 Tax=Botrytis sinoallii TaxID=1463999 RepID=UPI00190031FD|nr:uncharacterized protein EAF02_006044 [Botrytis sinoallii]KAF7882681.1 hypothetical protein EAF02_006044 [Botrytis sinoallii]